MAQAKKGAKQRSITIPSEDEGAGFTAWMVGARGLRWTVGVLVLIATGAAAWHQLGWWTPASRDYVHETVRPLDQGIKALSVGNLQNRIETLSSRRGAEQATKRDKSLQMQAAKGNRDLVRALQEQIDQSEQTIRDITQQIEDLQEQVRRKGS